MKNNFEEFGKQIRTILKAHPWHGISIGLSAPSIVSTYIEIVPSDTVKYELEKSTGYLMIDRPQMFSNVCPTPYGFIPQTYCGERVADLCRQKTGRKKVKGDSDPLDILVLTEKMITHNDILVHAVPIGGLMMIDGDEADDKIIAVMRKDAVYGGWKDINDVPKSLIERLKHYFLTYKQSPDAEKRICEIHSVYGKEDAYEVINAAHNDYLEKFRDVNELL